MNTPVGVGPEGGLLLPLIGGSACVGLFFLRETNDTGPIGTDSHGRSGHAPRPRGKRPWRPGQTESR